LRFVGCPEKRYGGDQAGITGRYQEGIQKGKQDAQCFKPINHEPMTTRSNTIRSTTGEIHSHEFAFVLKMGKWKNSFGDYAYKTVIAVALNACVDHHAEDFRAEVKGYLITGKRLFIVWHIAKGEPERVFHFFENRLRAEIRKRKQYEEDHGQGNIQKDEMESHEKLFEKHGMIEDNLVKLITGHVVNLGYYDPQLARLKAYLHQENFCSVADYRGAKGPVIVSVKKTNK
jgi:hypothetical protein